MSKFYGKIGYTEYVKTSPDVWKEKITERPYYGDVIRNTRRLENGEWLNDDVNVNNTISVVADAYLLENFFNIRYVEWMGARWKVSNIEVQRPRLVLTIGGLYNGTTK